MFRIRGIVLYRKVVLSHRFVRNCVISSESRKKLENALNEYDKFDLQLRPYRVLSAVFGTNFSNVGLEVVPLNYDVHGNICHPADVGPYENTNSDTVKFSKLFHKGMEVLETFVNTGEIEPKFQAAVLKLLLYLNDIGKLGLKLKV